MSARIGVAIQAHTDRRLHVSRMEQRLQAQCPLDIVLLGPVWATGLPWKTNREAWERILMSGVQYGLVIQDDLIMCEDFLSVVSQSATLANEKTALGFFVKDPWLVHAKSFGHWLESPILCGPAMLMRTDLVAQGINWIESQHWRPPKDSRDDHRWNLFFKKHHIRLLVADPQPLQHIGHFQDGGIGSTLNSRKDQTTSRFCGEHVYLADLDWS